MFCVTMRMQYHILIKKEILIKFRSIQISKYQIRK